MREHPAIVGNPASREIRNPLAVAGTVAAVVTRIAAAAVVMRIAAAAVVMRIAAVAVEMAEVEQIAVAGKRANEELR
jgi:hypothetical protein